MGKPYAATHMEYLTGLKTQLGGSWPLLTLMLFDIIALISLEIKIEKDNGNIFRSESNGPYTVLTLRFLAFLLSGKMFPSMSCDCS